MTAVPPEPIALTDTERPLFAKVEAFLTAFARAEVRRLGLDPREASEEFYKLALEVPEAEGNALAIRRAARSTRRSGWY